MYISFMKPQDEITTETPFGRVHLQGEREHGQSPPLKELRVLREFVMVYLFEGKGTYRDANQSSFELSAGSCLIIPPGTPHLYSPCNPAQWSELFFVFSGAVFNTWHSYGLLPQKTQCLTLRPVDYWLPKFRNALSFDDMGSDALDRCCRLQTLLSSIKSWMEKKRQPEEDLAWREKAERLIEANIKNNVALAETAAQLRVSYDHFRKRYKAISGSSPSAYRTQVQISQASQLLLQTRLPVSEIAEQLGFCDLFHFSKRFKQMTGFSPKQFRQQF